MGWKLCGWGKMDEEGKEDEKRQRGMVLELVGRNDQREEKVWEE
jgi:hypothetical protein